MNTRSVLQRLGATLLLLTLLPPLCNAAQEDLDEMARRAERRGTAAWPADKLEDAGQQLWQPESLCYRDVKTGHEVWRMTNTPNLKNYYHNDIAMSPWSANGNRLALQSWRSSKLIPGKEVRNVWMVVDAAGGRFRPTVVTEAYCHWSPFLPDTFYTFGGTRLKGITSQNNILYKVSISDEGPATAMKPLVTYPAGPGGYGNRKFISSDGKMLVAMRSVFPGTAKQEYEMFYIPTKIYPDEEAKALLEKGYSVDRDFGEYLPSPFKGGHYHDAYLLGNGDWFFAIDKSLGYWRIKTLGGAPDGGPKFTGDGGGGNFGEIIPVDVKISGAKLVPPWKTQEGHKQATNEDFFLGHPGFDRWGELVCYADYGTLDDNGQFYMGANVYDYVNHKPLRGDNSDKDAWRPLSNGCTHCDWEAFADWCVVSVMANKFVPGQHRIECFPYNERKKNFAVCYTHTIKDAGGEEQVKDYYNHIRPAQSPDGTKVAWHSDFLNSTAVPDAYWAVCYYPYPPTNLSAAAAKNGEVKLVWQTPSYTKRGWPNKDNPPPPAREIKAFHVWRAAAAQGPWEELGAVNVKYTADPVRCVMLPQNLEFSGAVRDGTWCYALTSEEWSGLESDRFSEILKVEVAGGKVAAAQVVEPAGRKDFWKTPPAAPKNLTVKKLETAGQCELFWEEPKDGKARYYNLYYSTEKAPGAAQSNRIASLPAGTAHYLDWLADPKAEGFYAITTVDRQGNESPPARP